MAAIQIRNVPDALHRELRARAAESGKSLSDYLLDELGDLARRPSMTSWLADVARVEAVELTMSPAEAIAAERRRAS